MKGGALASRVTLAQVAQRSGYSPTTVSMVLSGREGTRISVATRQRIQEVAKQMGYSADPRARALRTGRSETIGFVSDEVTVTRYASAMVSGAVDQAQSDNRVVLISECGVGSFGRDQAVSALLERRVDAILVGLMRARLVDLTDEVAALPAVIVNGVSHKAPGILPDEYAAGYEAAKYLIDQGHTRIGLIGRHAEPSDPRQSVSIDRRFAGIDRAMSEAGLSFLAEVAVSDWNPGPGQGAAYQVLANNDVTALLCANDRIAFGAYQAAARLGLSVPEDISVMSFDDEQLASYLTPGLTTMRLPYEEMGRFATRWVLGQPCPATSAGTELNPETPGVAFAVGELEGREIKEALIPMPLVERGSVAAPRS